MTNIKPLPKFIGEIANGYVESKKNPDEWYVLIGRMVGEYSVHSDNTPDDYDEIQEGLPVEDRDAQPHVDGHFQIGAQGWTADAFEDTTDLVSDFAGSRGAGKLDTALMNIIVVHEDYLSEEALDVANGDPQEAPADD